MRMWLGSTVAVAAICLALAAGRSGPVLLSFSPDPTELRPRNYCLMNPLRDRAPERASEHYLSALRSGQVHVVAHLLPPDTRKNILESERKWPIRSWRVGRRQDTANTTELMYWVKRGNGYSEKGYEEEVSFTVIRSGRRTRVARFGAIY